MADGISVEELDQEINDLKEHISRLEDKHSKIMAVLNKSVEDIVIARGALIQTEGLRERLSKRATTPHIEGGGGDG